MRDILKMLVVLSAICSISGFALSYLKMITAIPIEEQVLTYVQGPAIQKVFSDVDNSPVADRKKFTLSDGRTITLFPAIKNGRLTGVAMENSGKGFGGDIGVMTAFNPHNDTLLGIGITTMKETPGIGTVIFEPRFTDQFSGKDLKNVAPKAQGGSFDAISGATVSSVGAISAVSNATKDYLELKPEILNTWK